jgi:hypothetical protein
MQSNLLLIDVNEWIKNECAECMFPRLDICDWFVRSHPSKGENRTRNDSQSCKRNRPLSRRPRQKIVTAKLRHFYIFIVNKQTRTSRELFTEYRGRCGKVAFKKTKFDTCESHAL